MSFVWPKRSTEIIEVWKDNLEEEFARIREIVDDYPYIAMGTEVHGDLLLPEAQVNNFVDYNYHTMKVNVDRLKLTKFGLTFSDENGHLPTCGTDKNCAWQFNFQEFNTGNGIDVYRFGELLLSSGCVLNDTIFWVTFHGGYGFGHLLRLLIRKELPESQVTFFNIFKMYFPMAYNIKYLAKFCDHLDGDLNKLAQTLEIERIGVIKRVLIVWLLLLFSRKLKEYYFNGSIERYGGVLFGLSGVDA
ncbi:putative poly(A)-specific ribonuclease [Helianthus annuus]|nr:putative poly(A)-specific ribonuclease [Helianthus annuus]KAJ0625047.1 putative poly(A)-specific ribonuclease [Helianthus annuus]KAJ0785006.1 putative poly(A)-specific ribonuclease [Helianthus annuus]KAJ0794270.1 putative poly(A)-specific ribonuclease [Helianthus annuus]KAJ0958930.1 putative poly(A)-specific ribonuclease [Helianthus annuus]